LPSHAALDLVADAQAAERDAPEHFVVGVEDQTVGRALDVDGPAVVASAALVGDQGVGVLLALAGGLQLGQGAFDLVQVLGQPGQVGTGGGRLLGPVRGNSPPPGDVRLLLREIGRLGPKAGVQRVGAAVAVLHLGGQGPGPIRGRAELRPQRLVLLHDPGVQGLPPPLPFGLAGGDELGVLVLGLDQCVQGLGPRHRLGPAVDDEQEQDQRSHGAEQHRQERERRDLQDLPAAPHAAAPLSDAGGR
jgi:hypothetical protein